ncbi:MAG TPA: DUF1343 domain-containing protein [Oscillatoriaceae cyanobacterium]
MRRLLPLIALLPLLTAGPAIAQPRVKLGIDVLVTKRLSLIAGKRVGLITNMSAIDGRGQSDIDVLAHTPGVHLTALFAPEHGLRENLDVENIPDTRDPVTGVPVYSLYNKERAPTPEQMRDFDVLLFDIQDAGSRYYTFTTTLGLCLEAAAKAHKPFIVLDRPDPITGHAEGDTLDPKFALFTGKYPMTSRHGMTIGEVARYINGIEHLHADLTVVPMEGWRRDMWYDQTGLPWRKPSPAMLSPVTALYYAGIGMFEATNVDCRSAPGHPFEWVGAKWMNGKHVAPALTALHLPGVRFWPEEESDMSGVGLHITNRDVFQPVHTAVSMMETIHRLYPDQFKASRLGIGNMTGSDLLWETLNGQASVSQLWATYHKDLKTYDSQRAPYLLYR